MKTILVSVLLLTLSGCAGALAPLANYIDSQDPCQSKGKSATWTKPDFCGAASGHTVQISRGAYNGTYLVNVK